MRNGWFSRRSWIDLPGGILAGRHGWPGAEADLREGVGSGAGRASDWFGDVVCETAG